LSEELSPRQRELLLRFEIYRRKHGTPPTIRELGDLMDPPIASTNGVNDILKILIRKRLLARKTRRARSLTLTAAGLALLGVNRCTCTCHSESA
jgi:SOS-response transcriptional repressor LexA